MLCFSRSLWVRCRTCHNKRCVKHWQKSLALILYLPTWTKWEAIVRIAWIMLCLSMFSKSEPKCSMLFICYCSFLMSLEISQAVCCPVISKGMIWRGVKHWTLLLLNGALLFLSSFLFSKVLVVICHRELLIWLSCLQEWDIKSFEVETMMNIMRLNRICHTMYCI